jgi:peptidoglycan-associated lipoprotein
MRVRSFMLIAATALLAACASEPEEFSATPSAGSPAGSGSSGNLAALPAQDPTSQEWLIENVGDRVFFEFDQSDLSPQSQETVEKLVAWMQSYPDVTLTLEGHADERGTREYNLALGDRRANAVRRYMEALGMDGARLSVISYGNEQPEVVGSNELAWSRNRRAVFVVN